MRRPCGHLIRRPTGHHPVEDMIAKTLDPIETSAGGEAAMIVARSAIRGSARSDVVADADGSSEGGAE